MATDKNFLIKKGLQVLGSGIYINDTNTRLHEGSGNALRITTGTGYIDIGSMNTGWVHMQMNKNLYIAPASFVAVDGDLRPYTDSARTLGATGTRWSHTYTDNVTVTDDVTIGGNLTVNGTVTTVNQTNLDVSDNIIGLNRGITSNSNDSGIIIERGSTGDNVFIGWDESSDRITFATTTNVPSDTGNITFSVADVQAGAVYTTGNIVNDIGNSGNDSYIELKNTGYTGNITSLRQNADSTRAELNSTERSILIQAGSGGGATGAEVRLYANQVEGLRVDASGNVSIPSLLQHLGDTDTYMQFTDGEIDFFANGVNGFMTSSGGFVVNPNSGNYDFIVRGDTVSNLLYGDASADGIGIYTSTPAAALHIQTVDVGIKSTYAQTIIESTDAQLDLTSSSSGTWGSAINFIEGAGASNTDVWSIARKTTGGAGDSSLNFNFGTSNQHDNNNKVKFASGGTVSIDTGTTSGTFLSLTRNVGTEIGRISYSATDNIAIYGTTASHAGINLGTNVIVPMSAGVEVDDTVSLGDSTRNFAEIFVKGMTVGSTQIIDASRNIKNIVDYHSDGRLQAASVHGQNTFEGAEILFEITDWDDSTSIKRKFGYNDSNSNFSKATDLTAPASGVFDVYEYVSTQWGQLIPIDDETEVIFECWAKHISGDDTSGNFYAGSSFYDSSGTYLGNNSRYWGANGDAQDADDTGWRFIRGVMRGDAIRAQSATSTAKSMQLLTLFNYNTGSGWGTNPQTTRFCGFRFYRSKKTVTSLWLKISNGTSANLDSGFQTLESSAAALVVGHDQRIYANATTTNTTPQFTFTGDTDTGFAYIGTDSPGIIAGGSRKFYVNSTTAYFQNLSGGVIVPALTATSLDLNGNADISGSLTMSGGHIYLTNFNIYEVNALEFNDPGPNEGLSWSGGNIKIYESPNDLTTNSAGNLQVVYGSTRRLTVDSSGIDVNGRIALNGVITTSGQSITVDPASGDAVLVLAGSAGAQTLRLDQNSIRSTTSSDISIFTDGNTRQIFLDQSSGYVGINMGSSDPTSALDVNGQGTFKSDSEALRVSSVTNGVGATILFSDNGSPPALTSGQRGYLQYYHGDGSSYGSGNTFILTGTETTMTVLADGKLMFKEGLYIKPSSGTGAGTQIITSAGNLTNIGTISSGAITSSGNITGSNISVSSTNWIGFGDYGERISGSNANSSLTFSTNATQALLLDASQNATFAGTISSGAITSSGTLNITGSGNGILIDNASGGANIGIGEGVRPSNSVGHTSSDKEGIFWHNDSTNDYGIFRTAGAWSSPSYQKLQIKWVTGIELDGGSATYTNYGVNLINSSPLRMGGTIVIDGSRNLTNIPSISNTATITFDSTGNNPTVTLNRYSGQPSLKAGTDDGGYLIMDSSGGRAALNWYSSDHVVLAQGGGNVGIGVVGPSYKYHQYGGDMMLESGTGGTTGKLIFKTTDNADTSKYIRTDAYYVHFNGNPNEGFKFTDNSNTLLTIYGTNNANALQSVFGTTVKTNHLYPNTGNSYDLGASGTVWRSLYINALTVNDSNTTINSSTTSINSSNITVGNNTTDNVIIGGGTSDAAAISGVGKFRGYTKNYADSSGWVKDTDGFSSQTGYYGGDFSINGSSTENSMDYGTTPDGTNGLIWTATSDTTSNADGGWNKDMGGLSHNNSYISIVYVKRNTSSTTGTFYHGCSGSHTLNLSGTANTNPYFHNFNIGDLPQDVWCVSIGLIRGYDSSSTTDDSITGVYRCDNGQKINNGVTYKMSNGATVQRHRVYLYYSTGVSSLSFYKPGFYEVNGTEPSLRDIIHPGLDGATFNGDVSVTNAIAIGEGPSAMDTSNLSLETTNNVSIRGAAALYFGVTTNNYNSWKTRIYNANSSTMQINAQALNFNNSGYGSSTFFLSNSTGFDIRTGGLLINQTEVIDSSRNGSLASLTTSGNINLTGGGTIEAPSVSGGESLTLKAAGGVNVILDSNGNGGDDQKFKIFKHTDTELFSVQESGVISGYLNKFQVQADGTVNVDNGGNVVKYSLWSGTTYGIGMNTGYSYGSLGSDYAMTFRMNDSTARGYLWLDTAHTGSQGAMSLTTDGRLTVANNIRLGFGESDTTAADANIALQIKGNMAFGEPGGGTNANACWLSFEGNTDGSGEGSGRIFFREHNSTTAAEDAYGMSLGYRGGGTTITSAGGNSWTGLSQIANGEWGMWGHDGNATGALIMHGPRDGTYVTVNGNLEATGNVTAYASDLRLKENIKVIDNAIERVLNLRGVEFDWKDNCEELGFIPAMKHETGVIAQEVEKVIPDAVTPAPFNDEYLTVHHEKIIPVLIEAIKEQQTTIESLKNEISNLVKDINSLKGGN